MDGPRIEDFPAGAEFEVAAEGAAVTLHVDLAEELPRSPRPEGGFRIEFVGPAEPLLAQATYAFRRNGESVDIFITAIAQEPDALRYEAVFY